MDETIRAIYFLSGRTRDWMAAINQSDDGFIEVRYRFRYYDAVDPDNDPWSGKDKKTTDGYRIGPGTSKPDLLQVIEATDTVVAMLVATDFCQGSHDPAYRSIRGDRTLKAFYDDFVAQPFVHSRTATTPEDVKKALASDADGVMERLE